MSSRKRQREPWLSRQPQPDWTYDKTLSAQHFEGLYGVKLIAPDRLPGEFEEFMVVRPATLRQTHPIAWEQYWSNPVFRKKFNNIMASVVAKDNGDVQLEARFRQG